MKSKKFYPDIAYNSSKRRKTLSLAMLMVVLGGGTALSIAVGGTPTSTMLAIVMGAMVIFVLALVPTALKQYPTKYQPLIEVFEKEVNVNGETIKLKDIKKVRITIQLGSVGKDSDNEQFINSLVDKKPEANITGDVDFLINDITGKGKVVYCTIADCYECLEMLYKLGVKHYEIIYSLKKLTRTSTYDISKTVVAGGVELSQLSKKDRAKQLF